MRLLGDITTNHSGDAHRRGSPAIRTASDLYYVGAGRRPTSPGAACRPCPSSTGPRPSCGDGSSTDPDSVTARWLRVLRRLAGRRGQHDRPARAIRTTLTRWLGSWRRRYARPAPTGCWSPSTPTTRPRDLDRDGWHGTMNYGGFLRPVWSWLRRQRRRTTSSAYRVRSRGSPAPTSVATMRGVRGAYVVAVLAGTRGPCSARTTRPGSGPSSGDAELVEVGVGLLATMPGTPMVFAGDECGLTGVNGEDSRRPMPWDRPDTWDAATHERYRALLRAAGRATRAAPRWAALRARR